VTGLWTEVKMPQLGESVTEGTIGRWLKQPGDPVRQYEPIAEIVTDKVTAEVPSDVDGVMGDILVREGETVAVGTVICRIRTENPDGDAEAAKGAQASGHAVSVTSPGKAAPTGTEGVGAGSTLSAARSARGRFSPAVLRLAQEHGIPLDEVEGTGEGGRITRKDVLAYIARRQADAGRVASATDTASGVQSTAVQTIPVEYVQDTSLPPAASDMTTVGATDGRMQSVTKLPAGDGDVDVITPSPVRRTIARRMVEARRTAPHAWTMVEADVTGLVALRERWKNEFRRKEGVDLTYLPFFIKAVVEGLKQYPMLNAAWQDDRIVVHRRIHIGIAVATDDALVVPVIRDADRLSIAGLAHAVHDLATRARAGRLTVEDMQGGTFTVNNTGAFGSILSQPILNLPQAAIITMEAIVKRPVVVNDAIAIRSMVNVCLSLDHRVLDGWVAGQFLKAVRERLQSFDENTVIW
jgi:2-oxoisovalerate dehydrogenase E2 component (dihydrolipoyl transacylase)